MRLNGRSQEREDPTISKMYIVAISGGIFAAILLIIIGKGIRFLIGLIIEFWIFVAFGIVALIVMRRFLKTKRIVHEHHGSQKYEEFD